MRMYLIRIKAPEIPISVKFRNTRDKKYGVPANYRGTLGYGFYPTPESETSFTENSKNLFDCDNLLE